MWFGEHDTCMAYDSFEDVPAGCDSVIRVAGIVYKKNIDNWIAL